MIIVRYQGRHGNFIFQYLFARYISHLTEQTISSENNYYTYTANRFIKFTSNSAKNNTNYKKTVQINDKNAEEMISNIKNGSLKDVNFEVNGYFQDASYYESSKDLIKSIMVLPNYENLELRNKDVVLIHLRLDDFHRNGYDSEIISFQYYEKIIQSYKYKQVVILYDDSTIHSSKYKDRLIRDKQRDYYDFDKKYIQHFKNKYDADLVYSKDVGRDFKFFQNFQNIILSGSSFSFWAVMNLCHRCKIHIPVHPQINATQKTYEMIRWMGHDLSVYDKVKFVNYNEDLVFIDQVYPSCEGYVTQSFERNKNIRRLYLSHHSRVAGFFSNCSMALYNVVKYYNYTGTLPDKIDMTLLFELYKKGSTGMSVESTSLCKILHFDKCICKTCYPDIQNMDGDWRGRYTHNCYKTRNYDLDVGPYYFKKFVKPNPHSQFMKSLKKSQFAHWSQFYPYTNELMETTIPFFKETFSPSDNISNIISEIEKKYDIDYENLCVIFMRRGDKGRETTVPEYEDYTTKIKDDLKSGSLPANIRFMIQSDETEFFGEMSKQFENCFEVSDYIRTVPAHKKGQPDLGGDRNFLFSQKFLAVMNVMAKAKYIYGNTGNCILWTYLYRSLYKSDYQTGFHQWIGKGHHWKQESKWITY